MSAENAWFNQGWFQCIAVVAMAVGFTWGFMVFIQWLVPRLPDEVHSEFLNPNAEAETFADLRDGQTYKFVTIGSTAWMAENLNYASENSICREFYQGRNDHNRCIYGRMYFGDDAAAVCPSGWHLPSRDEWRGLGEATGDARLAGYKLKSKIGWKNYYKGASGNGTDEFGFWAIPAGEYRQSGRSKETGVYWRGRYGYWWSATEDEGDSRRAYSVRMANDGHDVTTWSTVKRNRGFSVRCVQDAVQVDGNGDSSNNVNSADAATPAPIVSGSSFTDPRDKQKYRAVTINGNTWMAENLNFKTENSWCYGDADSNCIKYGRLYTWRDAKGACPRGWRLPSLDEWDILAAAGGGGSAGKALKSKGGWDDFHGKSGNGTNALGFSALPGGARSYHARGFGRAGYHGSWWSATEEGARDAYSRYINYQDDAVYEYEGNKMDGLSVRCVPGTDTIGTDLRAAVVKLPIEGGSSFTDPRNKQTYRTVKIGGKTWMAENLNYKTKKPWMSWCYASADSNTNCAVYGRLYTWDGAADICPSGWHLPSRAEWGDLINATGDRMTAGKMLKSKSGWGSHRGKSGNGADDYGFSALPGYYSYDRSYDDNDKSGIGYSGHWWSATEASDDKAYSRAMFYHSDDVTEDDDRKLMGLSVRCVKGGGTVKAVAAQRGGAQKPGAAKKSFIDSRDGKAYKYVNIGKQTWMAENLNFKSDSSDCFYCETDGMLYVDHDVMTVCPKGWHLPSDEEWRELMVAVGGTASGSGYRDAGNALKSKTGWIDCAGEGGNGTDDYGFSALPAGHVEYAAGIYFRSRGRYAYWWSATRNNRANGYDHHNIYMNCYGGSVSFPGYNMNGAAYSVRCVMGDAPVAAAPAPRLIKGASSFTDPRDNRMYRTVKIGEQTWMAENLNYYKTGTSWCYGSADSNCVKHGRLYAWDAAKNACPSGWHLPSGAEWDILISSAGGKKAAGKKLKTEKNWHRFYTCSYGDCEEGNTDDYGFSALPSGLRSQSNGSFSGKGSNSYWWSATESSREEAQGRGMNCSNEHTYEGRNLKSYGFSVRCVMD
jgi:uncharacterized protein (TIGR02145 family)